MIKSWAIGSLSPLVKKANSNIKILIILTAIVIVRIKYTIEPISPVNCIVIGGLDTVLVNSFNIFEFINDNNIPSSLPPVK